MEIVQNKNTKTNKLETMPVGKLLFSMSIPAIISMLIQALYNVIDSIYVSNITNENDFAIDALSYAYPLQMIVLALALGVGIGSNSLISRLLGEKRKKDASNAARIGLILAIGSYLITLILSFFLPKLFISAYKANSITSKYAIDYLTINMMFSFGVFIEICSSKILQSTGNMKIPMIAQLIGAICNIILDPFFIFGNVLNTGIGIGLGVKGAAIATVISQIAAMSFSLFNLLFKKQVIKIEFKNFKNTNFFKTIKEIYRVGIPVTVMNSVTSFLIILLNKILELVDPAGVTILGIYFKLQSFVFMPVFGLTQGLLPILGYNYGSNKQKRFNKSFYLSIFVTTLMLIFGTSLFLIFPKQILGLFNLTDNKMNDGAIALRIISACFIPAGIAINTSTMFQSLGEGFKSLIMSLLRQVLLTLPISYIIAISFNTMIGVWVAFPIAEIFTIILFFPIGIKTIDKMFLKRQDKIIIEN